MTRGAGRILCHFFHYFYYFYYKSVQANYVTWMSQISPGHGYEQGYININCAHLISSKAPLANRGTPVLGRAPTPPPVALSIPFSGSMNSGGHGDMPSGSPTREGLVPWVSSFGVCPSCKELHRQGHTLPKAAHTQQLLEEEYKDPTISARSGQLWWATRNPQLLMGLAEALSGLHHSLTSLSAQSCFLPLPPQLLISNKYPAYKTPVQHLLLKNPTRDVNSSWLLLAPDPAQRASISWHDLLPPSLLRFTSLLSPWKPVPRSSMPCECSVAPCETERTSLPLCYIPLGSDVSLSSQTQFVFSPRQEDPATIVRQDRFVYQPPHCTRIYSSPNLRNLSS